MKVLIAGDSITEGEIGFSYIDKIMSQREDIEITNLGVGGDTLIGITNRLIEHLKKNNDYDVVILEAGHNDILLPVYESREGLFRLTAKSIENRGSFPIKDEEVFYSQYQTAVRVIKRLVKGRFMVTTLSCLNENLEAPTNLKREKFNESIKKIAQEQDIFLIPIGDLFDLFLMFAIQKDYLMQDYLRAFVIDSKMTKSRETLSELSDERGLNLTIDGVHLNEMGSEIYADAIIKALDMENTN